MFAPTGAGKGRNVLIPTLLSTTDAVVALDVKGELARETARFREHHLGQRVFVLDPWGVTGLAAPAPRAAPSSAR